MAKALVELDAVEDLDAAGIVKIAVLESQVAVTIADPALFDARPQARGPLAQKPHLPGPDRGEFARIEKSRRTLPRVSLCTVDDANRFLPH